MATHTWPKDADASQPVVWAGQADLGGLARTGLERAEDLAGIGIAAVIWVSAAFAGFESIRKLIEHGHTAHVAAGIAGAALGIVGNQVVARYKRTVGRRINSATLIADARHSWLDGALAGLVAVAFGQSWGDPVAGLAVTAFICHVGYEVTRDVVHRLADDVDPDVITTAEAAAGSVPGVIQRTPGRAGPAALCGWKSRAGLTRSFLPERPTRSAAGSPMRFPANSRRQAASPGPRGQRRPDRGGQGAARASTA